MRTTIARIFNTYGPRMALDDGRSGACNIRDLVDGLVISSELPALLPQNDPKRRKHPRMGTAGGSGEGMKEIIACFGARVAVAP